MLGMVWQPLLPLITHVCCVPCLTCSVTTLTSSSPWAWGWAAAWAGGCCAAAAWWGLLHGRGCAAACAAEVPAHALAQLLAAQLPLWVLLQLIAAPPLLLWLPPTAAAGRVSTAAPACAPHKPPTPPAVSPLLPTPCPLPALSCPLYPAAPPPPTLWWSSTARCAAPAPASTRCCKSRPAPCCRPRSSQQSIKGRGWRCSSAPRMVREGGRVVARCVWVASLQAEQAYSCGSGVCRLHASTKVGCLPCSGHGLSGALFAVPYMPWFGGPSTQPSNLPCQCRRRHGLCGTQCDAVVDGVAGEAGVRSPCGCWCPAMLWLWLLGSGYALVVGHR